MLPERGVVLDASALITYAENDLRAFPIDELLGEMREDTGAPVIIPGYALAEARWFLQDDKTALERLDSFADAHGVHDPSDPEMEKTLRLVVAESGVSAGMAHAMVLARLTRSELATYTAGTPKAAGFDMDWVLDLDEVFRAE